MIAKNRREAHSLFYINIWRRCKKKIHDVVYTKYFLHSNIIWLLLKPDSQEPLANLDGCKSVCEDNHVYLFCNYWFMVQCFQFNDSPLGGWNRLSRNVVTSNLRILYGEKIKFDFFSPTSCVVSFHCCETERINFVIWKTLEIVKLLHGYSIITSIWRYNINEFIVYQTNNTTATNRTRPMDLC